MGTVANLLKNRLVIMALTSVAGIIGTALATAYPAVHQAICVI